MARKTIRLNEKSQYGKLLVKCGIPHTATYTNSTIKYQTADETYLISPKHLSNKELGFVGKVKRYAEDCDLPNSGFSRSDVGYFKFSDIPPGVYKDVVEIDVNSAYWLLAYRMGYLEKDTFYKGIKRNTHGDLEVSKMARLVALGSMAATKRVYTYDGEKWISDQPEIIENPLTRSYFFHVAAELDKIMTAIFEDLPSEDGILFWVDAFFIRIRSAQAVIDGLKAHGLTCKSLPIGSILCQERANGAKDITALMITKQHDNKTDIYRKPFSKGTTKTEEQEIKDTDERRRRAIQSLPTNK